MCGIFGIIRQKDACVRVPDAHSMLRTLYRYSETRGKESAGLHVYLPDLQKSWTLKEARSATEFIAGNAFKRTLGDVQMLTNQADLGEIYISHSRLVTNGTADDDANNQPVYRNGITAVHNGIITNVGALWQQHSHLDRTAEVDTEMVAAHVAHSRMQQVSFGEALKNLYTSIEGAATCAFVEEGSKQLWLSTNTGDLYMVLLEGMCVFASERYILEQTLKKHGYDRYVCAIDWVQPFTACVMNVVNVKPQVVSFAQQQPAPVFVGADIPVEHIDTRKQPHKHVHHCGISQPKAPSLRYDVEALKALKRCSTCVLPETFPFIHFSEDGECNYCKNYQPKYKGLDAQARKEAFYNTVKHYKGDGKRPDVLVPFSGGRDSSYGLHVIKEEFGFNPITFTYDWGMVTDLARRNIARMCGQLGVQNILVSANIKQKRLNIKKNVEAWMKNPQLGMVPLFMAGDKHFFKIVNQLKRQTGITLDLWSANPLENTDFKSGFCNISPDFGKKSVDYLSLKRRLGLLYYYAKQFGINPSYLNGSLLDTFQAFLSYYFEPRNDFYFMFDHMIWDEREVDPLLLETYNWETSPDSPSTWRIGDGTAAFYNYIYVTANGFSEFDTFRSNQIREGMMNRDDALALVLKENTPREESFLWYCNVVGLDANKVVEVIHTLNNPALAGTR